MDALETLLLLDLHLLFVDPNTTEVGHAIGFKSRAFAIGDKTGVRVILLRHADLLSFPERKGSLALLRDLNGLLFHSESSLLIIVHNVLVTRDQNRCWHWLMTELVFDHISLLDLLLHDHLVDLAFSSVRLLCLSVTHLKAKWLGNGHAVPAFSQRFFLHLMHVITSSDALLIKVTFTETCGALVPLETTITIVSLEVILVIIVRIKVIRVVKALEDLVIVTLTHIIVIITEVGLFAGFTSVGCLVVIVNVFHKTCHASTLSFFFAAFGVVLLFLHALILILESLDLVFREGTTKFGEVLNDS